MMFFEWSAYNNDILAANTPNGKSGVPNYDKKHRKEWNEGKVAMVIMKDPVPAKPRIRRKKFVKPEQKQKPQIYKIPDELYEMLGIIAELLDMNMDDYINNCRQRRYVRLRCIATALIRKFYPLAQTTEIGRIYGHKDHTSVLHYIKLHPQTLLSNDQVYMNEYYKCLNGVKAWKDKN